VYLTKASLLASFWRKLHCQADLEFLYFCNETKQSTAAMARRYDSSTTTFSPEGRLHQVKKALALMLQAFDNNAPTWYKLLSSTVEISEPQRRMRGTAIWAGMQAALLHCSWNAKVMQDRVHTIALMTRTVHCMRTVQVEYAIEAINNAGTCVGILAGDAGIVLAAERKTVSKLLAPSKTSEKTYKLDDATSCVVAGLTADANILINQVSSWLIAHLQTRLLLYTEQFQT
jgi:Proteasome subunit/Proteasome subunit A N-terminal signature